MEEEAAHEIPKDAADNSSDDMLDGFFLLISLISHFILHPKVRVLQDLPGNLCEYDHDKTKPDRHQSSNQQVKNDTMEDVDETVRVKHVLRDSWWIPVRNPERRP